MITSSKKIKLKIYQEKNHSNPHIHIEIGNDSHAASIQINPSEVLSGDVPNKYRKSIISWVDLYNEQLLELWDSIQNSNDYSELIHELDGTFSL